MLGDPDAVSSFIEARCPGAATETRLIRHAITSGLISEVRSSAGPGTQTKDVAYLASALTKAGGAGLEDTRSVARWICSTLDDPSSFDVAGAYQASQYVSDDLSCFIDWLRAGLPPREAIGAEEELTALLAEGPDGVAAGNGRLNALAHTLMELSVKDPSLGPAIDEAWKFGQAQIAVEVGDMSGIDPKVFLTGWRPRFAAADFLSTFVWQGKEVWRMGEENIRNKVADWNEKGIAELLVAMARKSDEIYTVGVEGRGFG